MRSLISFSNERPAAYASPALFHHRCPRGHRFPRGGLAASDPAGGQPAVEGARGKHRAAAFQPDAGRLHPDRSRRRPAAAGAQGGFGDVGFQDDGGLLARVGARNAARRHAPGSRIDPARAVRARPRHLAKEYRGLPSLRHERRRAGADRQMRTRRRILCRCRACRILGFHGAVRAHHRGRKIPAHAADTLRLPRDRTGRMERQGDGKGLGRPRRPALACDAASLGAPAAAR